MTKQSDQTNLEHLASQNHLYLSLVDALKDNDWHVRYRAIAELGQNDANQAVSVLIEALDDPASTVRLVSAETLGRLEEKSAVEPLIKLLADQDWGVRREAVGALGSIRDKKAGPALLQTLVSDPEYRVRIRAASVLGWIGGEEIVDLLIQIVRNPFETDEHRSDAVEALGYISDEGSLQERVVKTLHVALNDRSVELRAAAKQALDNLGEEY